MPLKERMDFKVKRFISISVNLHFCSHDDARSSLDFRTTTTASLRFNLIVNVAFFLQYFSIKICDSGFNSFIVDHVCIPDYKLFSLLNKVG